MVKLLQYCQSTLNLCRTIQKIRTYVTKALIVGLLIGGMRRRICLTPQHN